MTAVIVPAMCVMRIVRSNENIVFYWIYSVYPLTQSRPPTVAALRGAHPISNFLI